MFNLPLIIKFKFHNFHPFLHDISWFVEKIYIFLDKISSIKLNISKASTPEISQRNPFKSRK